VKETTLQAYQHQDVPFEQLVDYLNVSRDLNRNPIFQILFSLQNVLEGDHLDLQLIEADSFASSYPIAKFDLSLNIFENKEELGIRIEYSTEMFENKTIERMGAHFKELIDKVLSNPAQDMQSYSFLTSSEKQQLLLEWNDSKTEYPKDKTIQQLFEEQANKTPNNIALIYEDQELTYQQLNEKANQLAHYLIARGVGPDTLVAIAVEISLEMIIGLLAILKSGGAYVPLDPKYPQNRLQFMLEDTNAPILLTQSHLIEQLPPIITDVILLDKDQNEWKKYPATNPILSSQPHHLAYIIYTSGSTGKSKGVMVEHQNVHRLFTATQNWFDFNSQDVWALFHSYAFDFSVWEIWGALFYGGKLCIIPYNVSRDPSHFYQVVMTKGITVLNQTPSAFQQLINYDKSLPHKDFGQLRYIIFGGEALNPPILKAWFKRHGDKCPKLVNMYGITETTVHVTYLALRKSIATEAKSLIGRPIPDLQLYILDSQLNLLPVGAIGEIYIGGAGVARGYLNRPDLTKEKFIENPFASNEDRAKGKNTRLYKTGDLARYRPDGNIEYIGRNDEQVKFRGFRIELGEIKAAILKHNGVREAVVMASEDKSGDKKLLAYLVVKDTQKEPAELRHHLKELLP
ncbi:MAG: amino acid adenylation domain-containing protein, partial [Alphaproteobacteria bacterium]